MDFENASKIVVDHVAPILAVFLAAAVSALLAAALKKLNEWLGVKLKDEQVSALERLALDSVDYAEERARQWAQSRGDLMPSEKKLEAAMAYAVNEANGRGLVEAGKARIESAIHSALGSSR